MILFPHRRTEVPFGAFSGKRLSIFYPQNQVTYQGSGSQQIVFTQLNESGACMHHFTYFVSYRDITDWRNTFH